MVVLIRNIQNYNKRQIKQFITKKKFKSKTRKNKLENWKKLNAVSLTIMLKTWFLRRKIKQMTPLQYKERIAAQKQTPWFYIFNKRMRKLLLVKIKTEAKKKQLIITHTWTKNFSYKIRFKSRLMLQQPSRLKKNVQLRVLKLRRYKIYQRLFSYGYFVRGASDFFMHRGNRNLKYKSNVLGLKYDQILADILKFRIWSLRRFVIRPIYMKRLLLLYFGAIQKKAIIASIFKIKKKKVRNISKFFSTFQYCIFGLIYQNFRIIGLTLLLKYIKAGYFLLNKETINNPLHPCLKGDLVQFNVYELFKSSEPYDLNIVGLKRTKERYNQLKYSSHFFLFSFFRNTATRRPRKKRLTYVLSNKLINKIQDVSILVNQTFQNQLNFAYIFFKNINTKSLKKKPNSSFFNLFEKMANFSIPYQKSLILKKLSKEYTAYRYVLILTQNKQSPPTVVKELMIEQSPRISGYRPFKWTFSPLISKIFFDKLHFFRTKLFLSTSILHIRVDYRQKNTLWKLLCSVDNTKRLSNELLNHFKINSFHLLKQNKKYTINSKWLSEKTYQHKPVSHRKHDKNSNNLLKDLDIFAFYVINDVDLNEGRRSFLNKSCIRFILSFC